MSVAGGDGWEARMAARAAARRREALPERRREPTWWTDRSHEMTLADGMRRLGPQVVTGCACCGPPFCCIDTYRQALRLHRAAHIVAQLLAAAATSGRTG